MTLKTSSVLVSNQLKRPFIRLESWMGLYGLAYVLALLTPGIGLFSLAIAVELFFLIIYYSLFGLVVRKRDQLLTDSAGDETGLARLWHLNKMVRSLSRIFRIGSLILSLFTAYLCSLPYLSGASDYTVLSLTTVMLISLAAAKGAAYYMLRKVLAAAGAQADQINRQLVSAKA